jgi:D-serine deaminase-like pyridoxal phosphate-dependent protein
MIDRQGIETPAVVIQRQTLDDNIRRMQTLARAHGLRLRPHVKTHKCLAIARRQMAAGACGVTAAKVDEALLFIRDGIPSLTLAQPQMMADKLDRLMAAAQTHGCDLRLIVDSRPGLELLASRAVEQRVTPGVFIKIDVGLHRCGCRPHDPAILSLAETIRQHPQLQFVGLLSHAGHAYGAKDRPAVAAMAEDERRIMLAVARRLEEAGVPVPEISVGATPTVLAATRFDGITEIRPGNYVFMDQTPLRLGLITLEQVALTVWTTVISRNPDFLIVDAGSKTFSSDTGAHGVGRGTGFGVGWPRGVFGDDEQALTLVRLSEEHGFISRSSSDLALGARLRFIPNHACPVANLARRLVVVDGRDVYEWSVDARGRVR